MRFRHGLCPRHTAPSAPEPHCPNRTCPLSRAPDAQRLRICQLGGDRTFCARMASLGMLPGREVELLRGGDCCLVRLEGSTLSLDRSLSEQILVSTE